MLLGMEMIIFGVELLRKSNPIIRAFVRTV